MAQHNITPAFIKQFESEVLHAYQEKGQNLSGTVRHRGGVTGSSVVFPLYGTGVAIERGTSASEVITMGTGASQVELILKDFYASEYSDFFDELKLNFDDRQELAKVIGWALRRTEDTLIANAMAKSCGLTVSKAGEQVTSVAGVTNAVGTATSILTLESIMEAKYKMDAANVEEEDRFFVTSSAGLNALLKSEKVTSADFNTIRALVYGQIDTFMGFKFVKFNDTNANAKTGLPLEAGKRVSFAYQKDAVAHAVAANHQIEANYVPERLSNLITGKMSAGALTLKPAGVVPVLHKEAIA